MTYQYKESRQRRDIYMYEDRGGRPAVNDPCAKSGLEDGYKMLHAGGDGSKE